MDGHKCKSIKMTFSFFCIKNLYFALRMGNIKKAVSNMMLSFSCELFEKNQNLSSPLVK